MREIAHAQKRNSLSDLDEILQDGRYPRRNHVGNFGDDRLRGLGVARGQILAFPIDFDRRPYNVITEQYNQRRPTLTDIQQLTAH